MFSDFSDTRQCVCELQEVNSASILTSSSVYVAFYCSLFHLKLLCYRNISACRHCNIPTTNFRYVLYCVDNQCFFCFLQTSKGESRIPTGGGSGASENKRRSLLAAPKCGRSKSPTTTSQLQTASKPDVIDTKPVSEALTIDTESKFKLGDCVAIGGIKCGVLKFFGTTHFAEGLWCGIELDDPDGKHNGEVDGHQYFSCSSKHGIFAPAQKVELKHDEARLNVNSSTSPSSANSGKETRLPSPDKTCRLPQPKSRARSTSPDVTSIDSSSPAGKKEASPPGTISKLIRPKSATAGRPKSAETAGPHVSEGSKPTALKEPSITAGKSDAFKSKLIKPSFHGKAVHGSTPGHSEDSNNNQQSAIPQSGISKPRSLLKRPSAGKPQQTEQPTDLGKTYTIESSSELDADFPEIVSPSRVDTHTALTLAYDLEGSGSGSGSDSELPKQGGEVYRTQQPLPDLISPSTQIARTLASQDFMFSDSPDALFTSQISTVSSIGILTEEQLAQNNLLGEEDFLSEGEDFDVGSCSDSENRASFTLDDTLKEDITPTDDLDESGDLSVQDMNDPMETEIDQEIAGISTPEVDFSSTASKEGSSPEPDATDPSQEGEFDLTYQAATKQNKNLESPTKEDGTAGEKMASPLKDNGNGFTTKQKSIDSDNDNTELICSTGSSPTETVVVMREKKVNPISTGSDSSPEEFPKRMRTSADLDEIDTSTMTASFELAKTAVSQYAELVKASEEVKRKRDEQRASLNLENLVEISDEGSDDDDDEDEEEEDSESETTETITSVDKKRDSLDTVELSDYKSQDRSPEATETMDIVSQAELDEEADQLIADLQAGHHRSERPISMISTGSADTGIVADFPNNASQRRERPVSLISTSSVDTG